MDVYTDPSLKHPLNDDEYKVINEAWNLNKFLDKNIGLVINVESYRKDLIKTISKRYTRDQFYVLEEIINKLFWNLRDRLEPIFFENGNTSSGCQVLNFNENNLEKLASQYRSNINKRVIVDRKISKIIHIKDPDNFFNNFTSMIMTDRSTYEDMISNPRRMPYFRVDRYYFKYDYGFPNINYCKYWFGTLEQRLDRIKKMYYHGNDYYWYNLMLDKGDLLPPKDEQDKYSYSSDSESTQSLDSSDLRNTEYGTYLSDRESASEHPESDLTTESSQLGGKAKWKTFCHNGVMFPPEYKQHFVPVIYKGDKIILDVKSEEAATLFTKYLETEYMENKTFKRNFWRDWKKMLGNSYPIESLEDCDFSLIYEHIVKEKQRIKDMSKEEKEKLKKEKEEKEEKYKTALVDGVEQPVGNFRIEPPGIFIGRGCHPKMGKIKRRIYPLDVTLNIGRDCEIPEPMDQPGYKWGKIIHDRTVEWLASWKDTISDKTKYVWLASHSNFKAMSDKSKFDFAKKLKRKIKSIREKYESDMKSDDKVQKQLATALYFIDTLALRIGNEKGASEADTVGVTSLRVEHIKLGDGNKVTLDFLGKDSIRYIKTFEVSDTVYKNLEDFERAKPKSKDLFDKITATSLNRYIQNFMTGLTAKVFRTYNASRLMQKELIKATKKFKDYDQTDKISVLLDAIKRANIKVALLCNHRKKVSKSFDQQIERINNRIKDLQRRKRKIKKVVKNKQRIDKINNKIKKLKGEKSIKLELKDITLETSKANYIDPRIIVSFTKTHNIPIGKIYSKQLQNKFSWAFNTSENYRF